MLRAGRDVFAVMEAWKGLRAGRYDQRALAVFVAALRRTREAER